MADEINEKMEQIRLKNEELEKKHKEILADELEAKKQGATVQKSQITSSKTTEHPYDNLDLDYDVKQSEKELVKNPDYKPKNRRPILGKKQLDEIPPDPVNFLRDDGDEKSTDNQQSKRPQQNNHNNNRNRNRNNRPRDSATDSTDMNNKEAKPRNQNPRPKSHTNQQDRKMNANDSPAVNNKDNNSPRKTHPQQLRERRSVPNTENSTEDTSNESNKPNSPQKQNQNRPRRPNNNNSNSNDNSRPRPKQNKEKIDGNHDITVEVTDEVRSVKLKTSEKTYGTGRVRPSTENIDEEAKNQLTEANKKQNKPHSNNRNNHNRRPKPKGPPQPEFQHPVLDKIVITKTSVQDRLLRSKMMDDKDVDAKEEPKIEDIVSSPAEN